MTFLQISLLMLILSCLITISTMPFVFRIAKNFNAIDYPDKRRVNKKPIPRMGGIAIFIAVCISLVILYYLQDCMACRLSFSNLSKSINYTLIVISILLIFITGCIDDVYGMEAKLKFILQFLSALICVSSGLVVKELYLPLCNLTINLGLIGYPVTIFFLISFANILNLIDGLDGLASGVSLIAIGSLIVIAYFRHDFIVCILGIILSGSLLGFLKFNTHPAVIFLGDSGSLFIGYLFGVLFLMSLGESINVYDFLSIIILFGVPITDTLCAIIRRMKAGTRIGTADKKHIHHRLLENSYKSQLRAVIHIYMWCGVLSVLTMAINVASLELKLPIIVVAIYACWSVAHKYNLYDIDNR